MKCQEAKGISADRSASALVPAPVPLLFGPSERPLFGWYHAPRPGLAGNTAVVLCNPMGHEALCAHASYRYLAERLAEAGYPALRFDYDGTGDSFGSDEDNDRVGSWLASIGWAIDALRDRSRTSAVSLFGMRLGATLAAVAAAERGDVYSLLLWAACRSGRSFLRELRVLRAAHSPKGQTPQFAGGQAMPVSDEEAGGFVFTRPTVEALNRLDAASLIRQPAPRALMVSRDDLPDDPRLSKSLAELGTEVTQVEWAGYAAMMRDAQDTEIPLAAIESLVGWLDSHWEPSKPACPVFDFTVTQENPPLTLAACTEEPVFWETNPRSFGVLTRSRMTGPPGRTAILLLNVGANHHIGPNRMYVALARQLAAQGFFVLRLDVPGIGDSAAGGVSARQYLYSASAVEDVKAAVSYLETHVGAERFVLIGLCSGAYTAYRTAGDDPRVSTQILINPQTFEWEEGNSLEILLRQSYRPTHSYVNLLSDTDAWKRLLCHQVDLKGICEAVCRRLTARIRVALRSLLSLSLGRKPFETEASRTLQAIAERGTDTLLIFAADDPGMETTLLHLGTNARKLRRRPHLRLEVIEEADHTFTPKAARDKLLSMIERHLLQRYPGVSNS